MTVQLTPCQQNGLFKIQMSSKHIVICGPAGTGKTFLLRCLLDAIGPNKSIAYCAPTHQAKQVLAESVQEEAYTIHSILKIHPETYEDEVSFKQSEVPDLNDLDILVVDEVSMLDGHLFSIMLKSIPMKCRIIGLGDPYQIQPVKNEPGIISPIFMDERFDRVILSEIVRQSKGNPIIEVATDIRKNGVSVYEYKSDEPGIGVFKHSTLKTFMKKYFEHVKCAEDMLKYKIMAYTNDDVDKFNGLIRQHIYKTNCVVIEGEYIIPQEPISQVLEHKGLKFTEMKFHNGETTRVKSIKQNGEILKTFSLPDLPHLDPIKIKYYNIVLESLDGNVTHPVNVIFDEESTSDLSEYLHYAAINYKRMARCGESQYKMKKRWNAFWELRNMFKDVKGAAACTFHKSQGSTFEGAFIYTGKLQLADPKIRRQLEYVGVTRAKKFVDFI